MDIHNLWSGGGGGEGGHTLFKAYRVLGVRIPLS